MEERLKEQISKLCTQTQFEQALTKLATKYELQDVAGSVVKMANADEMKKYFKNTAQSLAKMQEAISDKLVEK